MMELLGRGDVAMNLIGLILIAALSSGIVAVSLRLRASTSARVWPDSDRLLEENRQQPAQSTRIGGGAWLQDPFGLKGETGLYQPVKDQFGS